REGIGSSERGRRSDRGAGVLNIGKLADGAVDRRIVAIFGGRWHGIRSSGRGIRCRRKGTGKTRGDVGGATNRCCKDLRLLPRDHTASAGTTMAPVMGGAVPALAANHPQTGKRAAHSDKFCFSPPPLLPPVSPRRYDFPCPKMSSESIPQKCNPT